MDDDVEVFGDLEALIAGIESGWETRFNPFQGIAASAVRSIPLHPDLRTALFQSLSGHRRFCSGGKAMVGDLEVKFQSLSGHRRFCSTGVSTDMFNGDAVSIPFRASTLLQCGTWEYYLAHDYGFNPFQGIDASAVTLMQHVQQDLGVFQSLSGHRRFCSCSTLQVKPRKPSGDAFRGSRFSCHAPCLNASFIRDASFDARKW